MLFKKGNRRAIFIVLAIFAISINLRPAITSIGPLLEIIRSDLALSNAQVSLLTAVPVFCMGVFASLAPYLSRKLGLKWTVYLMLVLISIATAIRGFISGFPILVITAFMIGIAIAVLSPLISTIIKQHFPNHTAFVIGIYSFGMGVGAMVSTGLTGVFYTATSSYQFALSVWGILGLVGILIWKLTPENELNVRQMNRVAQHTTSPWKNRKAWLLLLFFGLQTSLFFSIMTWLVPIATSVNMTLLQAGSLLSLMSAVQIVANITIPVLLTKIFNRNIWILLLLVIGLIATIFLWSGLYIYMWIGAVFMGISLGGLFPISLLLPLDETNNAEDTNKWTAMMQTGGFMISGTLPLIIAISYDYSENHNYTYGIIVLLFILMFILTCMIHSKKEEGSAIS